MIFSAARMKASSERRQAITFTVMVYPEDYDTISASINSQNDASGENIDYVEYRIVRNDGSIRWVDDYGHFAKTATHAAYTMYSSLV